MQAHLVAVGERQHHVGGNTPHRGRHRAADLLHTSPHARQTTVSLQAFPSLRPEQPDPLLQCRPARHLLRGAIHLAAKGIAVAIQPLRVGRHLRRHGAGRRPAVRTLPHQAGLLALPRRHQLLKAGGQRILPLLRGDGKPLHQLLPPRLKGRVVAPKRLAQRRLLPVFHHPRAVGAAKAGEPIPAAKPEIRLAENRPPELVLHTQAALPRASHLSLQKETAVQHGGAPQRVRHVLPLQSQQVNHRRRVAPHVKARHLAGLPTASGKHDGQKHWQ